MTVQIGLPAETTHDLRNFYRAGSVAAFMQLGCVLITLSVFIGLGAEPETAADYIAALNSDRLNTLLRADLPSLLNVVLYAVTAFALLGALNVRLPALFATALVLSGIAMSMATNPIASLVHLSNLYATAATAADQAHYLAAAEAVLASDWWRSTGGMMAGIFLQGGMVLLHWLMRTRREFSKITAWSGILANGLDWIHIPLMLFAPAIGAAVLSVGGIIYLVWFPLLGRDLWRLARA